MRLLMSDAEIRALQREAASLSRSPSPASSSPVSLPSDPVARHRLRLVEADGHALAFRVQGADVVLRARLRRLEGAGKRVEIASSDGFVIELRPPGSVRP